MTLLRRTAVGIGDGDGIATCPEIAAVSFKVTGLVFQE